MANDSPSGTTSPTSASAKPTPDAVARRTRAINSLNHGTIVPGASFQESIGASGTSTMTERANATQAVDFQFSERTARVCSAHTTSQKTTKNGSMRGACP